jgi:hypothetical protein
MGPSILWTLTLPRHQFICYLTSLHSDLFQTDVRREDGARLRACRFTSHADAVAWGDEARSWLIADDTQDDDRSPLSPGGEFGDRVEFFFREPQQGDAPGDVQSTLYLLRKEIQDCLIGRLVSENRVVEQPDRYRLFASAMVIFAGIDLLAKFTSTGGTEGRFTDYLVRFALDPVRDLGFASIQLPRPVAIQASRIYDFRNALMHSFGLHHE